MNGAAVKLGPGVWYYLTGLRNQESGKPTWKPVMVSGHGTASATSNLHGHAETAFGIACLLHVYCMYEVFEGCFAAAVTRV